MGPPRSPDAARRSTRSRNAILRAAFELCSRGGYAKLSVDAIAERAGVGKQTIYRWWRSKGAVVADAVLEELRPRLQFERTGRFLEDVRRQLRVIVALLRDPILGRMVAELIGEAQYDPALAAQLVEQVVAPLRGRNRTDIARAQQARIVQPGLEPDVVADLLFGPLWFRFLVSKGRLDDAYVEDLLEAALSGVRGRART